MNDRPTRRRMIAAGLAALGLGAISAFAQDGKKPTPKKKSGGRPRSARPPASRPSVPAPKPPPPWPDENIKTVGAAVERLAAIPFTTLTDRQRALATVLRFCVAIGRADGNAAAEAIDAVGYQKLPIDGPLGESPEKPLPAKLLAEEISRFKPVSLNEVPLTRFRMETPFSIETQYPAIATWALESDFVVVIEPESSVSGWILRSACIVVRVRAGRPTIIGGNLFDAYQPPNDPPRVEPRDATKEDGVG